MVLLTHSLLIKSFFSFLQIELRDKAIERLQKQQKEYMDEVISQLTKIVSLIQKPFFNFKLKQNQISRIN